MVRTEHSTSEAESVRAEALHQRAQVEAHQGRYAASIGLFQQAIRLRPSAPVYHLNLSNVLRVSGRVQEALASCNDALRLAPRRVDVHLVRGQVLAQMGRIDVALQAFETVISIQPGHLDAHLRRGTCLMLLGRMDEALIEFDAVLRVQPNQLEALTNQGWTLEQVGRFGAAHRAYSNAVQAAPEHPRTHWNHALSLLLHGDFSRGWEEFEWRWQTDDYPAPRRQFTQPTWDGTELEGRRILIHVEQGFGDSIQFARYLPSVAERGGRVIVECKAPLVPLLERLDCVEEVATYGEDLPAFDVHLPILSLPRVFRTTLENIPAAVPYFPAPRSNADRKRVGLVWAGHPRHPRDRERSIALAQLRSLVAIPGIEWVSLQVGERARDLNAVPGFDAVENRTHELTDFAKTADCVGALDLVISVDTAVAHLAAALAKPTWILLPFKPDWRWMLDREDSPWYPTARLFRQATPADWAPVVGRVAEALRAWTQA